MLILSFIFWVAVVSHDSASKECRQRLGEAYELNKKLNGMVRDEDLNELKRRVEEQDEKSLEGEGEYKTKRQNRKH